MKLNAVIATTNKDLFGESFSKEALEQMAEQVIGVPLSFDFKHELPGKVVDAQVLINELLVEIDIPLDLFVVPGLQKTGDELRVTELSITHMPADTSLPPLELGG